ncbi:MAG: hypothetical protein QXK47_03640 [Candidatus Bathyarchaeia archaeon]
MRGIHGSREENVQIVHEKSEKAAQKGSVRRRSRAEKVGRLKYIIELLKRLERQIGEIDVRTRTLMAGLREWISFEPSHIQKVACEDEVDVEIITCLIQKGVGGLLPSTIAKELGEYGLKRWDVTRRIQRMNKKLMKEMGQKVAEKRGHQWAPTNFLVDVWE